MAILLKVPKLEIANTCNLLFKIFSKFSESLKIEVCYIIIYYQIYVLLNFQNISKPFLKASI